MMTRRGGGDTDHGLAVIGPVRGIRRSLLSRPLRLRFPRVAARLVPRRIARRPEFRRRRGRRTGRTAMRRRVCLPARHLAKSDSAANCAPSRHRCWPRAPQPHSPHSRPAPCSSLWFTARRSFAGGKPLGACVAVRSRRRDWHAPRARQARPCEILRPQERFGSPPTGAVCGCGVAACTGGGATFRRRSVHRFGFRDRRRRHRNDNAEHADAADEVPISAAAAVVMMARRLGCRNQNCLLAIC